MREASYIILCKDQNRDLLGETELSISLGLSKERVRVWRSSEYRYTAKNNKISNRQAAYNSLCKSFDKRNKKYKGKLKFKVFRVGSKNCPVKIDWKEISFMNKNKNKRSKFNWRNLPFSKKENVGF
jgi:hypothetical protein